MVSWKMMSWKLSAVVCTVVFLVLGILIGKFGIPPDLPSWLRGMSIDGDSSLTERLMKEIRADNIEKNLKYFTQKAHIAGSPREEEELVNYIFNEWKSHLDSARIYPYSVLLSYPNTSDPNYVAVQLENGTEVDVSAKVEKILNPDQEEDPTVVNPFNAYSLPGTVMGDPVYVNYGTIEDFTYMKRNLSIDLNGTIAIARYGKIFRADKVKHAAEFGCVGMVLYSDPADYAVDSEVRVYPDDWWLPVFFFFSKLKLHVHTYNERRMTHNVIGYIQGEHEPDRYVVLGNHRDAWVFGAVDPSSASAAMMELSRAFGELLKDGTVIKGAVTAPANTRCTGCYVEYDNQLVENPNPDEIANGRKTVFDTWLANDPSDYDPTLPQYVFNGVVKAIQEFKEAARNLHGRTETVELTNPLEVRRLNDQLMDLERAFIDPLGISGRPWYRHVIFAPSLHDAYGSSSFPGLTDALFDIENDPDQARRWEQIKKEVSVITFIIHSAASTMKGVNDIGGL
ncbi:UNVERIFIED_CONTAM: hypothetical protein FKN15_006131 [Acipenser sinensis]